MSAATRTESGPGDLSLDASYRLAPEAGRQAPRVDLTGRIKLATADEDGNLGTGENDYALQVDLERGDLFGYVGYKVPGDPPGVDFDNVFYGNIGVEIPRGPATQLGLSLAAGADDQLELTLYLRYKPGAATRIRPCVLVGLSDGSPDWGFGVTVSWRH